MRIEGYNVAMQTSSFAFKENFLGAQTSLDASENKFTNAKATAISLPKVAVQKTQTDPEVLGKIANEALKLIAKIRENKSVDASEFMLSSAGTGVPLNDLNEKVNFVINSARSQFANFVQVEREYESLAFSTKGFIKAQGKQIELNLNFNLSRSFTQTTRISRDAQFLDPLVISFDGAMPSISERVISFDIDSDGELDQISRLGSNSGFIALDKNENGKIDDGSELFGTKSGDGFGELAKYDDDKNGWIDENDKIFRKLRIWQNDDDNKRLVGLGEVGVGAIFLGNTKGEFSFNDAMNEPLAKLRSSGFFLYESGRAGFITQIDLAKRENVVSVNDEKKLNFEPSSFKTEQIKTRKKDEESMLDKLKKRLAQLIARLAHADKKEARAIQAQINEVSTRLFALMSAKMF